MNNIASWIWVLIPIMVIGLAPFRMWLKIKEKQIDSQSNLAAEKSAQYAQHMERFEQRLRVLEQIATDKANNSATSATHTFLVDNSVPLITLSAPGLTGNAYYDGSAATPTIWVPTTGSGTITLNASASDAASGIAKVHFPALLGTLGLALIGSVSLWRAYRTTLRLYTGALTVKERKPAARAPAAPPDPARVRLVERRLPWVWEHASAVAAAAFRSLTRAPEAKMAFLAPLIMVVVLGGVLASGGGDPPGDAPQRLPRRHHDLCRCGRRHCRGLVQ